MRGVFPKKPPATKLGDAGLEEGASVRLKLARAKLVWPEAVPQDLNRKVYSYCVVYDVQGGGDDDDAGPTCTELYTTRPAESALLQRGLEWAWDFEFAVPLQKTLRLELWDFSAIFGHTMLAQGTVVVSDITLDLGSATTRTEVVLGPASQGQEDEEDFDEAGQAEGVLVLETPSDPQSVAAEAATEAGQLIAAGASAPGTGEEGRVGRLKLILWQARAIQCKGKQSYLVVTLGGHEQRMEEIGADAGKSLVNHVYDAHMEFPVSDLTDDLKIKVFESNMMRRSRCTGQVVVPLTSMLDRWRARPAAEAWYEILPPVQEAYFNRGGQYRTAMLGTSAEGFGLPRPEQSLGFVRISTELVLAIPAPLAYVLPPPLTAGGVPGARRNLMHAQGKVSLPAIKLNMRRIERKLYTLPLWFSATLDNFRWRKNPRRTAVLLALHTYIWWAMPTWQMPLVGTLLMAYLGCVTGNSRGFTHVYVYQDEVRRTRKGYEVPGYYKDALRERYNKYKAITLKVQYQSDRIASIMEKATNLLTWSDWRASSAAMGVAALVAAVFSMMLYAFRDNNRELFFYGGLLLFVPKRNKKAATAPASASRREAPTTAASTPLQLSPSAHAHTSALDAQSALMVIGTSEGKGAVGATAEGGGPEVLIAGYLYSKDWSWNGVRLNDILEGRGGPWQRRWCEVLRDPPVLRVHNRDAHGASATAGVFDVQLSPPPAGSSPSRMAAASSPRYPLGGAGTSPKRPSSASPKRVLGGNMSPGRGAAAAAANGADKAAALAAAGAAAAVAVAAGPAPGEGREREASPSPERVSAHSGGGSGGTLGALLTKRSSWTSPMKMRRREAESPQKPSSVPSSPTDRPAPVTAVAEGSSKPIEDSMIVDFGSFDLPEPSPHCMSESCLSGKDELEGGSSDSDDNTQGTLSPGALTPALCGSPCGSAGGSSAQLVLQMPPPPRAAAARTHRSLHSCGRLDSDLQGKTESDARSLSGAAEASPLASPASPEHPPSPTALAALSSSFSSPAKPRLRAAPLLAQLSSTILAAAAGAGGGSGGGGSAGSAADEDGALVEFPLTVTVATHTGKEVAAEVIGSDSSVSPGPASGHPKRSSFARRRDQAQQVMRIIEIREPNRFTGDKVLCIAAAEGGVRRQWVKALNEAKLKPATAGSPSAGPPGSTAGGSSVHRTTALGMALAKFKQRGSASGASTGSPKPFSTAEADPRDAAVSAVAVQQGAVPQKRGVAGTVLALVQTAVRSVLKGLFQTLRYLAMTTPDDLDLEHRYICSRQVLTEDEVIARLPDSTMMTATERMMARSLLALQANVTPPLSPGAPELSTLRVSLVGIEGLDVAAEERAAPGKGFSIASIVSKLKPSVSVVFYVVPVDACPLKYRSSYKAMQGSLMWREHFVFRPLKHTDAKLVAELRYRRNDGAKDKVIGVLEVPLDKKFADRQLQDITMTFAQCAPGFKEGMGQGTPQLSTDARDDNTQPGKPEAEITPLLSTKVVLKLQLE